MIEKITAYIEEHYDEELNRDQLANMVGISQEYFSRLFKTKTGTNFSKYLSELRIKKAQEYLLTSKSSLREIAQSVGYRDEFYLSHKFKQVTGDSPSLYMKRPKRIASVSANYTGCLLIAKAWCSMIPSVEPGKFCIRRCACRLPKRSETRSSRGKGTKSSHLMNSPCTQRIECLSRSFRFMRACTRELDTLF